MAATKQDLIAGTAVATGLTQAEARVVIDEFLELFAEELERGRVIEMRGFGTFYTKERKARPARNPRTGEVVPLAKRVVPLFKFSGALRKKIEAGTRKGDAAE
jgi:DNA-binding protein HU-beta/integration host factor subunit beta